VTKVRIYRENILIFFVTTIGMIIQVISFKYAGPYTEKRSPVKAAVGGLALRSLAYGFLGVSVLVIFYPIAAGIAYSVYCTASNTMVFNTLRAGRQDSSLGVYSALVGIATLLGSLISGFASFFLGFSTTFIVESVCLGFSAWLASLLKHRKSNGVTTA
jgi:MFS family permease